ncbi:hypothetical protein WJX84_003023 [Apatococcus fuscideae]|uniref:F-box domain-containing protein n=1 Tax=Apatococcus fuscideae TaxID=2026836 RepID=A0AAW1SLE6_9CHLO
MSIVDYARAVPSRSWESFPRAGTSHERSEKSITGSSGPCGVEELPQAVLSHILSFVDVRDQLAIAELVSKSWRNAARGLPQDILDLSESSATQVSIKMLCPNLQRLMACRPGDGRSKATMPLSADGALQVLRWSKKHAKMKHVVIDVEAYSLMDTWETTSYQRAIGVEPLWQTFLLLLEGASRISINQLTFKGFRTTGHARSSVAPSEMNKVTTSRAKDLAAALRQNSTLCGLHIPGSYLAPAGLEAIATATKGKPDIKILELSQRPLSGNFAC